MDIKQFEKELVARKGWDCKYLRIIGWDGLMIRAIGEIELETSFISKGKKIAAHVKAFFVEYKLETCTSISFERSLLD